MSSDKTLRVWDAKSGSELLVLKGHTQIVTEAAFSADGTRVVTSSRGESAARVWDGKSGAQLLTLGEQKKTIIGMGSVAGPSHQNLDVRRDF